MSLEPGIRGSVVRNLGKTELAPDFPLFSHFAP